MDVPEDIREKAKDTADRFLLIGAYDPAILADRIAFMR